MNKFFIGSQHRLVQENKASSSKNNHQGIMLLLLLARKKEKNPAYCIEPSKVILTVNNILIIITDFDSRDVPMIGYSWSSQ